MQKILPSAFVAILLVSLFAAVPVSAQLGFVAAAGSKPVSNALITASASGAIKICAFEARNQLIFDIESRIKAATDSVAALTTRAKTLPAARRAEFASIMGDVRVRQATLELGLKSARQASAESWPTVRTALASSYADFADTVQQAETTVAGSG